VDISCRGPATASHGCDETSSHAFAIDEIGGPGPQRAPRAGGRSLPTTAPSGPQEPGYLWANGRLQRRYRL